MNSGVLSARYRSAFILMRLSLLSLLLSAPLRLQAADTHWSRFRGPNGQGKFTLEKKLPQKFDQSTLKWSVNAGKGHSSPVIWGDKLFLSSEDGGSQHLVLSCFDLKTGDTVWRHKQITGDYHKHRFNSIAASTPAIDSDGVYYSWFDASKSTLMLAALALDGTPKWQVSVGAFESKHGATISPVIFNGRIFMPCINLGSSYITAYDSKTGAKVWQTPRKAGKASYASPSIYQNNGKTMLVFVSNADGMFALNPASGELLWEKRGIFNQRTVALPVIADDLIYASCGSGGGGKFLAAVRPTQGKAAELVWSIKKSTPYVVSTLAHNKLLYMISDGGVITVMDSQTGKQIYQQRMDREKRCTFYASPILVDELIYCLSREGTLYVIKPGKSFELILKKQMGEGPSYATPAVADGRMLIRVGEQLHCYAQ